MVGYNFYAIAPGKEPRLMCTCQLEPGENGVSVNRADVGQPTLLASEIAGGVAPLDRASMGARANSFNGKGLANPVLSVHKSPYGLAQTACDSAGVISARGGTKRCERERRARVMGANLSQEMGSTRARGRTGPGENGQGRIVGGRK